MKITKHSFMEIDRRDLEELIFSKTGVELKKCEIITEQPIMIRMGMYLQ